MLSPGWQSLHEAARLVPGSGPLQNLLNELSGIDSLKSMSTAPSVENRVAWAMKDPFCNCCPGGVRDAQTVELARQGKPGAGRARQCHCKSYSGCVLGLLHSFAADPDWGSFRH